MTDILTLARENGFSHIGFADMSALEPLEEVRKMCSADRCGQWNTNWSCPPACGSIEHAKRRIAQYNKCLLVQTSGELADEFDYDGMQSTAKTHKRAFLNFARQARILYPGCLPLTAGACTMEAFGLFVSDVCSRSGLGYNYGARTMTYTSCLLYSEE